MRNKCKHKIGYIKAVYIGKKKREAPYGIRLSEITKELLTEKAVKKGVNLHSYCLTVLTKHAKR